jgi:hypothetical protein
MHRRRFIALLGAAITAARTLRAQQKAMPVIGYLNPTSEGLARGLAAFRQGLSEAGFVEDQNALTSTASSDMPMTPKPRTLASNPWAAADY